MFEMREYQTRAINEARQAFKDGHKSVCLCMATGAGKSVIIQSIVNSAKGRVLYLTFRTVLIDQMKKYFKGLNVEFGTLQKYGKTETDYYDLIIIDEIHWAHGSKLQNNLKCKYLLGLTATPITSSGHALEFDKIIDIVQLKDLIDMGYASPLKVLSTSKVDTSKLKSVGGDFDLKQAYELMAKSTILKDIVNVYKTHAIGLKTIIYAVNIKHAEELKIAFLEAGIDCDTAHSKKNDNSIERFKNNELKLIINCDILVTGFDLPDIYCLILACPTKSLIKSTQIYGRATRLNPLDKNKEALIIDCAEVIHNTQHPLQRLDFTRKKEDKNKKCSCGLSFKIINKISETIDKYTYQTTTFYKCECGIEDKEDKLHAINFSFCESCGMTIDEKVMQLEHNKGSIDFNYACDKCGHVHSFRQILLSDKQLKEMHEMEVINTYSWEAVNLILKAEAKACGYKWQWVSRAMDILQSKNKTPKEIIERIKDLKSRGKKVGAILYV